MTAEKKSWSKAAWLSGALLVVPLGGLVALIALGGGDEDDDRPSRPMPEEPVVAPAVEPPPAMPDPLPRPAATPAGEEPVDVEPEEVAEEEYEPEEPEPEPSVLDPCCAALEELVEQEGPGLLRAAHRACTNARTFDDPSIGFRTVRRLLERQGYEVPRDCQQ